MKFTTRLYLYWVSIFFIFFISVIAVTSLLWGMNFAFWQAALVFIIVGIIPPAIVSSFFFKRLDYMESDDINPPSFSGQKKATFKIKTRSNVPFDELMQRVDRQWIISYSDRENKVLKFRTDSRVMSWGIGGYVKMHGEDSVFVVVYPIYENSRRDELFMNQTLRLMHAILKP